MYKILTLNQISVKGLERLSRDSYEVASEIGHPDAIMVRSQKVDENSIDDSVKAIARAGAGVNNICVDACSEKGVVVFNTPGANANAVKELVLTGILLASRGTVEGIEYAKTLEIQDAAEMNSVLEKEKKRFKGNEVSGKTLGVIGLGAIGSMVAEAALKLGMNVVGYDPALSVEAAWRLPSTVQKMENLPSLMSKSDYVTLHLPAMEATKNLINAEVLASAKKDSVVVNFARGQIVDTDAMVAALENGQVRKYVADFPTPELVTRTDVILTPHIGASTDEAEENCAVMAADQVKDFLENGNIKNSVNFPAVSMDRTAGVRLAIINRNVPKILGRITSTLADMNINVVDLINKSRGDFAYNLIDVEVDKTDSLVAALTQLEGVISVRNVK